MENYWNDDDSSWWYQQDLEIQEKEEQQRIDACNLAIAIIRSEENPYAE
jgi:hypothetical protein